MCVDGFIISNKVGIHTSLLCWTHCIEVLRERERERERERDFEYIFKN
jgi:hypothetical protein